MSSRDDMTDLDKRLTRTVQRTVDDIPTTTKEKQAGKRAQDAPPPSRETRLRGCTPFGRKR